MLWLETGHPRFHELNVTWRIGGPTGPVIATNNSRNLDLEPLNLAPGTVVCAEVRDPVGPTGIDWVRNPSTNNARHGLRLQRAALRADADVDGRRHDRDAVRRRRRTSRASTATTHPVAGDEVVYVETNHPADRVLPVTWYDQRRSTVANPTNSRNLDLGDAEPAGGDAHADGDGDRRRDCPTRWSGRSTRRRRPRRGGCPTPLTTLAGTLEHPVYFDGWDMWLDPARRPDRLRGHARPSSASSVWTGTAGSTTSASRSSRCPSRRSSSATPAPT